MDTNVAARWIAMLALVGGGGCVGSLDVGTSSDGGTEPVTTTLDRFVSEPAPFTVLPGDPSTITVHVAGAYDVGDRPLTVEVLANPNDLTSWTMATVARSATTPTAQGHYEFAVDFRPVPDEARRVRWPDGGVLRIRVVDENGEPLPWDAEDADDGVVVIANRADVPVTWQYLMEKPVGSEQTTAQYYATINAPRSLAEFQSKYGFAGADRPMPQPVADEAFALYYNAGDLGIGRDMHCRQLEIGHGAIACYVQNYGQFGGNSAEAFADARGAAPPFATVAMVYEPPITKLNAVQFMVYGAQGQLATSAQLDTHGDNTSIPQNCMNCHGGRSQFLGGASSVQGARFLPFDPSTFEFDTRADLTFLAQETQLRELNRMVGEAGATEATKATIAGMFPGGGSYDSGYVPSGWTASKQDRRMYKDVIAPYCRTCHAAFESTPGVVDPLALESAETTRGFGASIVSHACGIGPQGMPAAEATTKLFFQSSARAVMLAWLKSPGACAPID